MKYIEVTIHTEPNKIDLLTCVLMDMGIAGFVVSDPEDVDDFLNKEHDYDWDYVSDEVLHQKEEKPGITFYLDDDEAGRALLSRLRDMAKQEQEDEGEESRSEERSEDRAERHDEEVSEDRAEGVGPFELLFRNADDEEWKDNWKEYFKPARVTDRIVVKPSWESYEKQLDDLVIEIDPGMAFGTGTHPTTSLCMRLLEKYIESPDDVVLDVGCGSGILSIASALLGVKRTVGVEIDPVAVQVSKENVALNGLQQSIEIMEGDLTKGLELKADIVVANLMADLVMLLSEDVAKHLRGKAIYISSGILIEKKETVAAAVEACGFTILEILEEGEWCAIAAKKNA